MSTFRHLTIRKASAGSGKTYQLAYNFIRMMLGRRDKTTGRWHLTAQDNPNAHRHILAITFTNKATDEMKRRIVRELAIIAKAPMMNGQKSKYQSELMADFGLDNESYLTEAARRALRELLFDYAEFNVSTIDAFFQSVLRSFAYEADLSGNYEVSLDADAMVESGISETITDAIMENGPEGRMLKRWLEGFMTDGYRRGNSFNLLNNQGATRSILR
ncbi:MAG: UvrD-helicase domain-containing protein, partial [Muribaculaceae bacterium]|nr:UvrD-helicase domain-containing protein [Muribaculaceae bacterium]